MEMFVGVGGLTAAVRRRKIKADAFSDFVPNYSSKTGLDLRKRNHFVAVLKRAGKEEAV